MWPRQLGCYLETDVDFWARDMSCCSPAHSRFAPAAATQHEELGTKPRLEIDAWPVASGRKRPMWLA